MTHNDDDSMIPRISVPDRLDRRMVIFAMVAFMGQLGAAQPITIAQFIRENRRALDLLETLCDETVTEEAERMFGENAENFTDQLRKWAREFGEEEGD